MAKVLIVDDDEIFCGMLSRVVGNLQHDAVSVSTIAEGLSEVACREYDVVFLDVRLPDGNGLEALSQFTGSASAPEVIIITGAGDPNGAELAIKSGAWDYIQKPSPLQNMTLPFMRALQYRREKQARSRVSSITALKREGIVGSSPQMLECLDVLARVAGTDANVLIAGETGTGKELFAAAVHANSLRANRPFVVVDCSTLPETLVEGMLFGHDRGAFTGADKARQGLIKQADGGTLFLDEVGELPLNVQKAFLRVLQERRFRPLGNKTEIESDFRLVAATNRDLQNLVALGRFRDDLLFRLKSFTVKLPPLRGRKEDITELTIHHLARLAQRYGVGLKGYSPDFQEALSVYPWPGNVRELFHALESAMAAARFEATFFPKHLPEEIRIHFTRATLSSCASESRAPAPDRQQLSVLPLFKDFRDNLEQQYLRELMSASGGSIKQACRISGLSRSYLYELLKHHGITPPRGPGAPE
jgi:two-component system, NtrC family, response regulator